MPERSPKGRENFSRKREAILNALRNTDAHPTAEWVYRQLKPEYPDLSLGTVYRNLGRFQETGQAVSLGVIGGYERFDGDTEPHAHLVCERCGAVMDVYGALPGEGELESISERSGCRIESASLTFRGLCRDCLKGVQSAGEEKDSGAEKSDL
ncbi:MAG: transcriptional repressor [Acutalibacter sp.]|uniref:Fur family transcriptional regulator n=1 Tax=Acutalibacter sp. TaxID=1918636 RepID=UPI00216F03DF|nr:transcriptional repressor [Acutalibacter sp.]MCI9223889.1 transcriptional repressor [Acutalibacter sp.]